jgi:hypothetical protein
VKINHIGNPIHVRELRLTWNNVFENRHASKQDGPLKNALVLKILSGLEEKNVRRYGMRFNSVDVSS